MSKLDLDKIERDFLQATKDLGEVLLLTKANTTAIDAVEHFVMGASGVIASLTAEIRQQQRRPAFFAAWECGCTDTEPSAPLIPDVCPEHGDELVSDYHGRTKVELTHSGVSGYGRRDKDGNRR